MKWKKKNLIIIGAGACGREVLQWAKDINRADPDKGWTVKGFLDNNPHALDGTGCTAPIIAEDEAYRISDDDEFICAIGNGELRARVMQSFIDRGASFTTVIHPTAVISDTCSIGAGSVVYPFSLIGDHVAVGQGVIINSHVSVAHDARIGNHCTISAHCDITGGCVLGERVFMGTSSAVIPYHTVAEDAFICAGSTVMTKVKKGERVLGTPAMKFEFG